MRQNTVQSAFIVAAHIYLILFSLTSVLPSQGDFASSKTFFQTIRHNDRETSDNRSNKCLEGFKLQKNEAISYHGDGKGVEGGVRGVQNSFIWRVSLTGFDDDKDCCWGKQHRSIKILTELGTPEDHAALFMSWFY